MDMEGSQSSSTRGQGQQGQGSVARTSTADSADRDRRDLPHDHYSTWDPMKRMAESLLNGAPGPEGGVMGMFGGGADMEVGSVLCPFNDGSGRCFKVNCRYKHVPYSSKVLKELPKLQSSLGMAQVPSNTAAASLPIQMLPAEGCISKVVIVAAFDPWNFYLIPEHGWKCLCRAHEEDEEGNDTDVSSKLKQPRNFFNTLENIQTSLRKYFLSHPAATKRSDFNDGELVAVRTSSTGGTKSWYRAKIVGDPVCHTDDDVFKPVDVELHLLDYGVRCIKSSVDVTGLPEDFCYVPPLAYKCQLFGVSPILGTWSTVAATTFRELVLGRYCIAEVIRTSLPTFYNSKNDSTCDSDSSFINLHIKSDVDNYINVSQHLIDSGFGLEWNMFPTQPHLNDFFDGRTHKFALS